MSKNIVDGVLVEMSPSMIAAFDGSTSFGCERRGWFKYVMGLPEPMTTSTTLGENLHSLCESRLVTGKTPSGEGEAFGLYLAGQAMIESVAARNVTGVEFILPTFYVAGVPLNKDLTRNKKYLSKTDVLLEDGIIDWKTSSDIRRYGKTPSELATDTQMVIYAKALLPHRATVKLAHGQFQTKGRKSTDFVEVEVTQEHLDSHIHKVIIPKVERMKLVAGFTDAKQATPDFKKCFNCAFKTRCPSPESENVMSFFSKMKSATPAAAIIDGGDMAVKSPTGRSESEVPQQQILSERAKEVRTAITPPDAPKSDPAKAAVPVEGFQALPPAKKSMLIVDVPATKEEMVKAMDASASEYTAKLKEEAERAVQKGREETVKALENGSQGQNAGHPTLEEAQAETKRGRGRPPGAKNKPKDEPKPKEIPMEERAGVMDDWAPEKAARKFKAITISKGATINVGAFNSVRFDVSVTSEEHTYEEVYAEVSKRLEDEAMKYEAEMDAKTKITRPANEVVSK